MEASISEMEDHYQIKIPKDLVSREELEEFIRSLRAESVEPSADDIEKYINTKMSILIVDDQQSIRKIISSILRDLKFTNLDQASDGAKALAKLRSRHYDLIISDWNMPVVTGIEFLKEVRQDPNLSKIPFFMVTAESDKEKVLEALRSGATNYLVKPFTAQQLCTKLKQIFGKELRYELK